MADPVQVQVQSISKLTQGTGSPSVLERITGLKSQAIGNVEPPYLELSRSNRLFGGGMTAVAGGIVPVVDIPSTTAPLLLYNNAPAGGRVLSILRVACAYASGTAGAAGFSIFGGVTAAVVASPPVANASNMGIQSLRGYGSSYAFLKPAATVPTGGVYQVLDGIESLAQTVTGNGKGVELKGMYTVPPGYGFVLGALGDTGSSAKYIFSLIWAELEADLDN